MVPLFCGTSLVVHPQTDRNAKAYRKHRRSTHIEVQSTEFDRRAKIIPKGKDDAGEMVT